MSAPLHHNARVYGDWPRYLAEHGALVAKPKHPGKCAGCGSREFKEHGGQMVCAYCRSTP